MASEDAKNVAKEVLETIGSGEKVILGEIIRNNGYSENTSLTPKLVTETKSYQETIEPVVNRWIKERDRLTKELETRDLGEERYETLMKSIDLITRNIQLLSGKETERTNLIIEDHEKITNAIRTITRGNNNGSDTQGN